MTRNFVARHWARRCKLGRLAYWCYHRPRSISQEVGIRNALKARLGEARLKRRIRKVATPNFPSAPLAVSFLTGARFWHQTALCGLSLIYALRAVPRITIFDDGTLTDQQRRHLAQTFPDLAIRDSCTADAFVHEHLPEATFPNLHKARRTFILMKKLLDIALMAPDHVYLDSDMIFWSSPQELVSLYKSHTPFHMTEPEVPHEYGLITPSSRLETTVGLRPIPHFNSGIYFLGNTTINYHQLEQWTAQLLPLPSQQNRNMLEQTLFALLFATLPQRTALPASYYVAWGSLPSQSIVTHYVHHRKVDYMAWEQGRWLREIAAVRSSTESSSENC